jgi:hypothetical protein
MLQPQNLAAFSVWLTQAVTVSRSAWWQVCGCMRDSTRDKPCPKWWLRQCWRRGLYLSWETEDSWMTCGCSTMGHLHTSLFLCAMFWADIFQAAGLAVAHRHYCHGHHLVLTLPHQTIHCGVLSRDEEIRCGVLSREEWLLVATATTKICTELWKTPFAQ